MGGGNELNREKSAKFCNITFFELLLVAFVCLKVTGHIDWSWWWVLSPIWLPLLISLVLICMGVTIKILLGHIKD